MKEEEEEIDPWTQQSQPYPEEEENIEEESQMEILQQSNLPEKSQDFFPTERSIVKRHKIRYTATRIKHSPTRVKSRNFLSNISYTGISKGDFYNENFILDVYILLVKNLNPFSLQRKTYDKLKHEMVHMLWRECIPTEFYRYICQDENFKYLNGQDVSQPGVLEIVGTFIDQHKNNLRMLQKNHANYKGIFQYVYSHVFPEIYSTTEKRRIDLKSNFHILFKSYHDKLMLRQQQLAKQPINYETEHQEVNEFKQKLIKNFNEFSDGEEEELKQQAEKRKAIKREQKESAIAKKLKIKQEEDKTKESKMWNRLNELKSQFKTIKQSKKEAKKTSATIL